MATFNEHVKIQQGTGAEIQRIVVNFKKDSASRKTTVAYFQERLKCLREAWNQFEETDNTLRTLIDQPMEHEYFASGYYNKINDIASEYFKLFEDEIQRLESLGSANPANQDLAAEKTPKSKNQLEQSLSLPKITNDPQFGTWCRKQKAMITSLERILAGNSREEAPAQCLIVVNNLWSKIEEAHYQIWAICEDPEAEGYDMLSYTELETRVILLKEELSRQNSNPVLNQYSSIQLPKMSVPKFDGDYLKWQTFSDVFTRMIHLQPIPQIQKMWYLKTNVSGEAERAIRHLELTEDNYQIAWAALEDRFNNKRVLTSAILQRLLTIPNLTSEARAIRNCHDTIHESLAALKNLGIDTANWDPLLLHILIKKLDHQSHMLYEQALQDPRKLQSIANFLKFLKNRFQALEAMGSNNKPQKLSASRESHKLALSTVTSDFCKICNEKSHPIFYCEKFKLQMTAAERLRWVQSQGLCVNCFKSDHKTKNCKQGSCKKCNKKHNTLLHLEQSKQPQNSINTSAAASTSADKTSVVISTTNSQSHLATKNYVLLATAKVKIVASNGQTCEFRAVLDSGSQVNLVTQRLINKLSLSTTKSTISIEGVGSRTKLSTSRVNIGLEALIGNFSTTLEAFVLPKIIPAQPSRELNVKDWKIPEDIQLADPQFYKPENIDVLIGAEFYHELLRPDQLLLGNGLPLLQNSVLGWIIIGRSKIKTTENATCAIFANEDERLSEVLERFWRLDDFPEETKSLTVAESLCETHFANTMSRNQQGRFVLRLPFFDKPSSLGYSQHQAERRFKLMEKRLKSNPTIRVEYVKFMQEYEALGHMQKIRNQHIPASNYFIPHHYVLKPDSSTTKLRVVFDASAKTSSGLSLNDILQKGPTVQSELFSILLRFRSHRFVFTADIEKMYRQILVHDDDTAQQLIVWRRDDSEELQYYRLRTVTYGTTSAPYMATKCLQYLATQNMTRYPYGAQTIRDDFYVDDCLSGANDVATALETQKQITSILQGAGFKLRKWCTNDSRLLASIPHEDQEVNLDLDDSSNQTVKTLGLIWRPHSDELCGRAHIDQHKQLTKRAVASDLARIFDPLGIFGPVTVKAKIFMQKLWELNLSWDQELPTQLLQQWTQFRDDLLTLNNLKTFRHIFNGQVPVDIQLHTFVDASEQAYGAAVYVRATYKDKTITARLLCAKSKVAPMKKLTIPRLELSAAVLGANLTNRVKKDLKYTNISSFLWSDSEIVLSWIQSPSSTLHTFVANRISQIHQMTTSEQWHHVASKDNPADVLSRGINPDKLAACYQWFYGPFFIYGSTQWWKKPGPKLPEISNDIEKRTKAVVTITHQWSDLQTLIYKIDHRNSFRFLLHTVGYLRRPFCKEKPEFLALSPAELRSALLTIVKMVQASEFNEEIQDLKKFKSIRSSSSMSNLAPFIDAFGILRVGGRLESSLLPYDAKHPMVLPYNDTICKLIFQRKHEENKHCGSQALLNIMRQNFWPIKGKITARNIIHTCIQCSKAKPKLFGQIMGALPTDRVNPSRPFLNSGVDYCGPFWIHYKIRGKKPTKAYLAIFCCFSTKAVHLELVSDLTTQGFIGALDRFISRRGRCQNLYCDNATNFVGAKGQLTELEDALHSEKSKETIIRYSSDKGIQFQFIPPRAPHFGGLWEAAVKSAKNLLVRSVSTSSLTYEELETVVIGVEAILNSRPLTPISTDPNDLTALTPGHFLIGETLTAPVDPHARQSVLNPLAHWKEVSRVKHGFWTRWSKEYLNELQQRSKWTKEKVNLKEGAMVIIKDDNLPIMKWPIGRVIKTYTGIDGLIRVVEIKTSHGTYKRPVHLLAPLPTDSSSSDRQDPEVMPETKNSLKVSIPLNRLRKAETIIDENVPRKISHLQPNILITILALIFLPLALCSPITQQNFPNKPGIYFEGMGTVSRIIGEWKIITYYDLVPIQREIEMLRNSTASLEHLCKLLQLQTMCMELVNRFININLELQSDEKVIRRRKPRGVINLVGNLANKLFGVLDSEYADNISKTINQMHSNEEILSTMIKNQTSVIDSTLNIVSRETSAIALKITKMQEEANNISKIANEIERHASLLEIYTSTVTQLSLMASNVVKIEAAIFDVIADSRHGRISPLLITPQQLQEQILKIRGHLPPNLWLPFNQDDVIDLYGLISSQHGITENYIIFIMNLPLTDNEQFDLFNLIPIPFKINNTMLKLRTEASLLAVTSHRDQYFMLTDAELKVCISIKQTKNHLLCSDKHVKYHQGAHAYSCEVNMLKNKTDTSCIMEEIKTDISWQPLQQTNQWIFSSKFATQITAVCKGVTELLHMQGSNLLTLHDDCVIKHHTATIQTHQSISDTLYVSHVAFNELLVSNISKPRIIYNDSPLDLSNDLQQLKQLHENIKMNNIIELPQQFQTANIHHHLTSYSALVLVTGIILCCIWKFKQVEHTEVVQANNSPIPAPRFIIDPHLEA